MDECTSRSAPHKDSATSTQIFIQNEDSNQTARSAGNNEAISVEAVNQGAGQPLGINPTTPTAKKKGTTLKPVKASTGKANLVRVIAREHPTVTIEAANLERAMGESSLVPEVERVSRRLYD
ncbi:hypothetical protein BGZ65_003319 [Modicella reniformis]|uniref:Uncharacterized protein n=1 Tax=Modicella reniformis TaxID=1440133 RepID=A0A9P6IKQ1_9FUNG|nr:hypothetical protein BGZ65_003319 [Modicella reniformis]